MKLKINKNTLFLFDFWIIVVFTLIVILFIAIRLKYHEIIRIISLSILILFILINIIKSIIGFIFSTVSFIKKEIKINKLFHHILFILLSIGMFFYINKSAFDFDEPIIYYTFEVLGFQFTTYQVFVFMRINTIINSVGIPMWLVYYSFSNSNIKHFMKIIINILTPIIVFLLNLSILYGLLLD